MNTRIFSLFLWIGLWLGCFLSESALSESRIKDLASIQGVRTNQLVGYGLVVGLEGTGDKKSVFTDQSFKTMLKQLGITIPANQSLDIKNVAAVALSAQLPPFVKTGQNIDVTVSSIGSAKSLSGGTLLMAPLRGADGNVYAMAQGNVVVSGLGADGGDGSKIKVNVVSVGRIANGATVERTVPSPFYTSEYLVYDLFQSDFTTAKRMADAINEAFGPNTAKPLDSDSIQINAPKDPSQRVSYVSVLENLEVEPADAPAKVVVNARTGTIVIGDHVRVKPVAVAHGNLTVTITEHPIISQPNPAGAGQTVVVQSSSVKLTEGDGRMFYFQATTTLKDIVYAINSVGAAPGDLMAILEALKEIGALQADLVVI